MRGRDAFTAIADPTRREILDLLRAHAMLTAGDIATHFSTASRPGISRHLRVLRESGLVTVERDGKAQNYTLNPKPLNDMRNGWLANFADIQVRSLTALRRRIEREASSTRRRRNTQS